MKSLTHYIQEKLQIQENNNYKYFPKTKRELENIIKVRIKKEGKEANLNDIDVSRITDMSYLFYNLKDFNGDISNWDVSRVTDMSYMFDHCESFNQDISIWDVECVGSMRGMFAGCKSFNQDLSNWDVKNVKYMDDMFYMCPIQEKYKPKF